MNIFGDGISWDDHVDQVVAEGKSGKHIVYYEDDNTFLSEVKQYITTDTEVSKRRALDAGCHVGRWTDVVTKMGFEYNGVDQSAKALEEAKKNRPNANFYNCMLWDMNFKEEFDLVFFVAVLQHNKIEEQDRILPKAVAALKSGGVLFFTESTINYQTVTQRTHDGWISAAEKCGVKFVKSFHKNELGHEDMYIFVKP